MESRWLLNTSLIFIITYASRWKIKNYVSIYTTLNKRLKSYNYSIMHLQDVVFATLQSCFYKIYRQRKEEVHRDELCVSSLKLIWILCLKTTAELPYPAFSIIKRGTYNCFNRNFVSIQNWKTPLKKKKQV